MPTWWSRSAAGMSPPSPRSTAATAGLYTPWPAGSCGPTPPAEEVTQEVFLDLWRNPEKFDAQRGTLRSFLLARTHGKSVDVVRSEEARKRHEERTTHETGAAHYDIDREVWDMTVAEQVKDALGALPDDLRRPIELAYFGGRTYQEVAVMLDQREGTIKSRIRSGLGRLRVTLMERGVEPAGAGV